MQGILRHYRLFYQPFTRVIVILVLAMAVENAIGLAIPWIQGLLINELVAHESVERALMIVGAILLSWLSLEVIVHLRWRHYVTRLDKPLRLHVIEVTLSRLTRLSLGQHLNRHSGVKQSTISEGQMAIRNLLDTIVFQIAPTLTEIIGVIVLLALANGIMAVVVILGAVVFTVWARILNRQIAEPLKEYKQESHREGKFRGDILRNMPLVLLTSQEKRAVSESSESFDRILGQRLDIWLPYGRKAAWRDTTLHWTQIGVVLVGVWLVWTGQVLVGSVFTWWMWSGNVTNRIGSIGRIWRQVMEDIAATEVYLDLLEMESDVPVAENPVRPERFKGDIVFENVRLTYQSRERAGEDEHREDTAAKPAQASLKGASLAIQAGQRIAFVGLSGSGKSSLVYALMRGHDTDAGTITIDGHDLRDLDPQHWRSRVGIVPQQVFLFDKSVRYNVCLPTDPDAGLIPDETVWRALDIACMADRVRELEFGLDTIIGERGIRLSGGEQQRVGIARAIVNDPDILIFDEATSNLDMINERLIHDAVRNASIGRTTIIIAHRLSTIRDAHAIFVVDDGRVTDSGTHDKLMITSPLYQELTRHQNETF